MLSRNETKVMSAIYSLCDGTDECLASPLEILSVIPQRGDIGKEKLDNILNDLRADGYFDLICSERKGEKMYVIALKESGKAFQRAEKQRRRDVTFRIFLAFLGALATFIFGTILKALSCG